MTPRRTVIGTLARLPLVRSPVGRRTALALIIMALGLLAFFPERYRTAVSLAPTDPATLGLSGTLGQLGAINSVFGNQAAIEVALKVARSVYVREIAAKKLNLQGRMHFRDRVATHRWLEDKVKIRTLRGGIIQFETSLGDAELGKDIVGAYANATQNHLARISRQQTEYKRDVLVKLVTDASDRLARARGAYDTFRLRNGAPIPEAAISEVATRIPVLQSSIRAKEVELAAVRQFGTSQSMKVQQVQAELGELRRQLAAVEVTNPSQASTVGRAVQASALGEKLLRELYVAQSLYDNYRRFLEGTSVEDLTSTANVRILEAPFVDTERQINLGFLAAAIALALFWGAIEFYGVRPAVGERVTVRETNG